MKETLGHSSAHHSLYIPSLDGCVLRQWEERSFSRGVKPEEREKEEKKTCFAFLIFPFFVLSLHPSGCSESHGFDISPRADYTLSCSSLNSLILSTFKSVADVKMWQCHYSLDQLVRKSDRNDTISYEKKNILYYDTIRHSRLHYNLASYAMIHYYRLSP